jgi:hypothetical protein
MRNQTTGAILDIIFCIGKITSAVFPQSVQGTVAKQAAEAVRISIVMTRKIFTSLILEKIIVGHIAHHPLLQLRLIMI